jgi:hypothetical protein
MRPTMTEKTIGEPGGPRDATVADDRDAAPRGGGRPLQVPRITIARIMIATAVFGASFAAFRFHLSLGSLVACVLCLAAGRAFAASDRFRRDGRALSGLGELILFVDSAAVALAIFAASTFTCFATCFATLLVRLPFWHPHQGIEDLFNPFGIAIGLGAGAFACGLLRRKLWPYAPPALRGRGEDRGVGPDLPEGSEEDRTPHSRAGVSHVS